MEHSLVVDTPSVLGNLKKMVTQNKDAIIITVDAAPLIQKSLVIQQANPAAMYHLGQALLAALLMQALPDKQTEKSIDLQWKVDGPFGSLFAECKQLGGVRGTLFNPNPQVNALKIPLGNGLLQIRRVSQIATTGIVESCGDVVLDILGYLEKSEQRNAALGLWVEIGMSDSQTGDSPYIVKNARGYLVDVLPHNTIAETHSRLFQWHNHLQSLGPISSWMLGPDPTLSMLHFISGEYKPQTTANYPVFFHCTCNETRAEKAFALTEKIQEAEGTLDSSTQPHHSVRCEFCGREYLIKKTS
jgi:redox-regulated HSP33 family molecular chaperone